MKRISLLFFSLFIFANLFAKMPLFYVIDVKMEIGSTSWIHIQKGFAEAKEKSADYILLDMNTYGGQVLFADSIRTTILNSEIPVVTFVNNNAASAGALIAIAADSIYMRQGANIGAATVVTETGEAAPDKYQSYMRATIRSTAEAHGKDTIIMAKDTLYKWRRDPLIAEAMVDERIAIPGVSEAGSLITFTSQEAIKHGYCEGIAESIEDVINRMGFQDFEMARYEPSTWDSIKGFLTNPVLHGFLIMIIIAGLYFELQSPGIGFPLLASVTAAVLYFAPLYIDGLAANWEIALFIVGLILIAMEIFVIPGFGVAGILGIIATLLGLILALIGNVNFSFEGIALSAFGEASITVLLGLIFGLLFSVWLASKIGSKGIFRKVAMQKTLDAEEGYVGVSTAPAAIVDCTGTVATDLRPSGKVLLDNEYYDAISEEGFIEKGQSVKITRYETGQIYVVKN
jgi:membrane-bound serine protease (ClpP class)